MNGILTLDEFIIQRQTEFDYSTGEFSRILRDIGFAGKVVHREVNKAGLVEILGKTGTTNVQGEEVQKLDEYANNRFIEALRFGGECAGVCSEENETFIAFDDKNSIDSKYIIAMDPLDGSSNIDVNVSVGTIFTIYRRKSGFLGKPCQLEDFLQRGTSQVAAGYIIYGSSTMLVYTAGHGVNGFTLDPSIGEFCLSHPKIRIPKKGVFYSYNHGNYTKFDDSIRNYVDHCFKETVNGTSYGYRYVGSMVADIHRNLLKGGIFMYPKTSDAVNGKLRLVYECNPMAFIVEQAGGRATNGHQRIMEIEPKELHQRTPIFIGSEDMVLEAESFL
ncbi:MAG: class 1 fructose-bisphosphatase [Thermodesulfobacteriota bacterium]